MKIKRKHKVLALAIIVCAASIAPPLITTYIDRKLPLLSGNVELYVREGDSIQSVREQILASGKVIRRNSLYRALFPDLKPKPGHYTINSTVSALYVSRMFELGWQSPVNLVLSGTMRTQEAIARKISRQLMLDSLDVIVAMRDSSLLAKYGVTPENVFSLFVPDTYQVYWTASMETVFDKQKAALDAFWTDENRKKAESLGLTVEQVAVLASIVNGETNYVKEMPAIAGVYLNRLRQGMKLQADPTVAFCFDYKLNRILLAHTQVDSPYNTYMYAGLPPAPICVPSKAAMSAVLNPDGHGYLYFCASPSFDGTHRFAVSYQEHLRNAREYQTALKAYLAAKKSN